MFNVCQYCLLIQMCHTPKVLPVLNAIDYLTALESISLFRRGLILKFFTANTKITKKLLNTRQSESFLPGYDTKCATSQNVTYRDRNYYYNKGVIP